MVLSSQPVGFVPGDKHQLVIRDSVGDDMLAGGDEFCRSLCNDGHF
jgi:hypothetical protein